MNTYAMLARDRKAAVIADLLRISGWTAERIERLIGDEDFWLAYARDAAAILHQRRPTKGPSLETRRAVIARLMEKA